MKKETNATLEAAKDIAVMRTPSVEKILRSHGFGYEADKIKALVDSVASAPKISSDATDDPQTKEVLACLSLAWEKAANHELLSFEETNRLRAALAFLMNA
jgi:hypothetical protein